MKLHPYRYSNGCRGDVKGNVLLKERNPPWMRGCEAQAGGFQGTGVGAHRGLMMWRRQAGGRWVQQPVQTRRSHSVNVLLCPHLQVACAPSCVADIHRAAVLYGGLYRRQRSRTGSGNWREHLLPVITGDASLFPPRARRSSSGARPRRVRATRVLHDVLGRKVSAPSHAIPLPLPLPRSVQIRSTVGSKPGGSLLHSGFSRPYRVLVGSLRWRL